MDDDDPSQLAPALPPPLQSQSALAHSKGEASAFNRYSSMVPEMVPRWRETFKRFDRDGGGDVDLRELGLMFRQLGRAPSEEQMKLFIEEVDIDRSGTIDFEEFCLLMMRQQRLNICPEWLYTMLHPPFFDDAPDELSPTLLPQVATLNDGKYEASQKIKRHMRLGKTGASAEAAAQEGSGSSSLGTVGARPSDATTFTRDMLLLVCDLLPSAQHIKVAQINGHREAFGPFVAQELLWRMATSTRTTLEHLELASNSLGEDGAVAVAAALGVVECLVTVDLSGNDIGQRGASALYDALCHLPPGSRLQAIKLDDNPLIPPQLQASICTQALVNNLDAIVNASRDAPLPPKPDNASAPGEPPLPLAQALEGMPLGAAPAVTLREEWLSVVHMPALRRNMSATMHNRRALASLKLADCPRMSDPACAQLLMAPKQAPPPPPSIGHQGSAVPRPPHAFMQALQWLRLSKCGVGDLTASALCEAVESGHLPLLVGLALDHNKIRLAMGGEPETHSSSPLGARGGAPRLTANATLLGLGGPSRGASLGRGGSVDGNLVESPSPTGPAVQTSFPLATRLGQALRGLQTLEELDLSSNEGLEDFAAASLVTSLLEPAEDGQGLSGAPPAAASRDKKRSRKGQEAAVPDGLAGEAARALPPSLKTLHLGATGAGNHTASTVANALVSSRLESLCLGVEVGDAGIKVLAPAIPQSATLRELWIGNKIGDLGVEDLAKALSTPHRLKLLGLGGKVRGNISMTNRLEDRSMTALGEALRAQPNCLMDLRLSGNLKIGGAAITLLIRSLVSVASLRELHVDHCGLTSGLVEALAFLEAMNEVWCLHKLVVEGAEKASGGGVGGSRKGGSWVKRESKKPFLSMPQRLALAKLLEDNRRMGRRRVESWRLSRSLEEVAWVFTTLCAGVAQEAMDSGLKRWNGEACGRFIVNVGYPEYEESVAFNLTGASLPTLRIEHLSQLGITSHDDQKRIMSAVRSLTHAFERREAVAKAQASWMMLLGNQTFEQIALADANGGVLPPTQEELEGPAPPARSRRKRQPRMAARGGGLGAGGRHPGSQRNLHTGSTASITSTASLAQARGETARATRESMAREAEAAALAADPFPSNGPSQRPDPSSLEVRLPQLTPRRQQDPLKGTPMMMPREPASSHADLGRGLPAVSPRDSAVRDPTSVGQPTTERDGAGALPPNPWMQNPKPPQGAAIFGAGRSPRAHGRYTRPDALARQLRRDEELSRRILASLAQGGKLPEDAAEAARFVVPAKQAYTYEKDAAKAGGAGGVPMGGGAQEMQIIRRRLGVDRP